MAFDLEPGADLPPDYAAPVHRSLTEPILMAGAPRTLAIINGTLAAAMGSACASGSSASPSGSSATPWPSGPPATIPISSRSPDAICASLPISISEEPRI